MSRYSGNSHSELAFTGDSPSHQARNDYINLIQAVRSSNEDLIEKLVNNGAPVNRLFDFPTLTPLHIAVQLRSAKIIRILLDKGADVNAKSWNGDTPLILAAKTEDFLLVDALLSSKICNSDDSHHFSHLHIASMRNKTDIVEQLLTENQGENLNKPVKATSLFWQGYTPLHFAVHFGCVETTEYLLECGADMMAKNSCGLTPLHLADAQRNEEIIDLLLSFHTCEIRNPSSRLGLSHFHIACTRDDTSIVEHFLKLGIDVNLPAEGSNNGPWQNWRPIHFAIYYRCSAVVRLLKQAGAMVLLPPTDDFQKYAFKMGDEFMYDFLTTRTIKLSETHGERHEKLNSFLVALINQDTDRFMTVHHVMPDLLADASVNINEPIWSGGTVLHLAVECGEEIIAGSLIDKGANILVANDEGKTPLHIAFYGRHKSLLNLLVDESINEIYEFYEYSESLEFADNDGLSIFHILCTTNKLQAIEYFLYTDMDFDAQVRDESELWGGFTALHFACMYHQVEVVKLLLENGADILITNKMNLNPFDSTVRKMASDLSVGHESYFEILDVFFQISSAKIEDIKTQGLWNLQGISILHVLCFYKENEAEDLNLLRKVLITYRDQINQKVQLNCEHSYNKCTPLHFAMRFGNWEKAQLLLENGADPLAVNSDGRTPLECAYSEKLKMADLAERLSTFFTFESVNQTIKPSHFHMACAAGLLDIVTRVLEASNKETKKIFVNCCDSLGRTPLHALLQKSEPGLPRRQIARLLLENGGDANAKDYKFETPLHFANRFGDVDTVKLLIERGAEINSFSVNGHVLLYGFIDNNCAEEIVVILDNGFDINLISVGGITCLRRMFQSFSYEISVDPENRAKGPDCMIILLKHVKKLELIGSYVNEENRLAYADIFPYVNQIYEEAAFIRECEGELKSMEALSVSQNTSLRDILTKSLNEMASHCENVGLQELVSSDDFLRRFPIYGYLIKLQIKNGAARRSLLAKAKTSFVALIRTLLPQLCLEMIMWDMSEIDLRNIILSTKESEMDQDE